MDQIHSFHARAVSFALGIAGHVFVFRRGEWDLYTVQIAVTFVGLHAAAIAALFTYYPELVAHGLATACVVCVLGFYFAAGVLGSMLVYRGFFHRLCRFPGPFLARFSNFYPTYLSAKKLHLYEEVQQLHEQYGDFVRLGPSELSINNADAVEVIHGPNSACTKGPWYNVLYPMVSLQMIKDKSEHVHRRRVWDRGFSAKALREYEPRVTSYAAQLMSHIDRTAGHPIDATDWFNFYSFDVMGDLAWGKSFGMLQNGVKHYFMNSLHADMTNVGLFSHLIWLFPLFKATPILNSEHMKFWKWVKAQVDERRKRTPDRPDVFSWLLEDHNSKVATRQEEINLIGDAYLIAVAGSDTTAASLTCLFFQLSMHPECVETLQREIDELFVETATPEAAALGKLPYLNAVINETLRLHPPVPSGLQRMTPPHGVTIAGTFVPGNTIVQVPTHTIFRDERYFDRPSEFIPERWTTRPELVKDAKVFIPFSVGRYSCIGKQLGLMEIRHVASQIVRRYDVALSPGQSPDAFLAGKRDTFTLALAPLNVVFSARK